jgi:hypothetical protein
MRTHLGIQFSWIFEDGKVTELLAVRGAVGQGVINLLTSSELYETVLGTYPYGGVLYFMKIIGLPVILTVTEDIVALDPSEWLTIRDKLLE